MKTHFLFFLLASTLWFQDAVWSTPVPGVGGSKVARIPKQKPNRNPAFTSLTPVKNGNGIQQITSRPQGTLTDKSKNKASFGTTTQLSRNKKSSTKANVTKKGDKQKGNQQKGNKQKGKKEKGNKQKGNKQTGKKEKGNKQKGNKQKGVNQIQNQSTPANKKGSKGKTVPKKTTTAKFIKKLPLQKDNVDISDLPTSDYIVQDETGKGTVTLPLSSILTCLQEGAKINNLSPRYAGHGKMIIGGGKNRYPTEMHDRKQSIPTFLASKMGPGELLLHHPMKGPDVNIKPHDRPHNEPAGPHRCFFSVKKDGGYRFIGVGTHYGAPNNGFTEVSPTLEAARWPSGLRRQTQVERVRFKYSTASGSPDPAYSGLERGVGSNPTLVTNLPTSIFVSIVVSMQACHA
ncbi:hypothetical protein MCOR25_010501 [Pyricularia grisea]|nr:hypothetical protein MCOR25_010501 [Pyricularia grisea]